MLLALRIVHAAVSLLFMGCIAWLWYCALARRRGRGLTVALGLLAAEAAVIAVNRGDCILGRLHARLGDDKGFFGLFLPPSVLPYVFPFFAVLIALGLLLLALRPVARDESRRGEPGAAAVREKG